MSRSMPCVIWSAAILHASWSGTRRRVLRFRWCAEPFQWTNPPDFWAQWPALKNAQRQTLRHRFAQGSAAFQFMVADALPGQNRFWRLRVGADNEGLCDGPKTPAGRNAFHLPGRVVPIAARADQACIGAAIDVVEHGVVAAVKKILELSADGCKVFRGGKNEPIRAQHVCGTSLCGMQQSHLNGPILVGASACPCCICHL